ncbi:hypothetical protein R50073_13500 [Maricurvus nonylphenolicus]|uniref:hypothetical protein n=1 Tax=Maricurvus nonylphenolicus TaxID=1008307 RepID=UPI0036F37B48
MKRRKTNILILLCILICGICFNLNSLAEPPTNEIRVGLPLGNPPWLYKDETTGELKGYELSIQQELFEPLGLSSQIKPYKNLVRMAAEMVKGMIDAGPLIYSQGLDLINSPNVSCSPKAYSVSEAYFYALKDSNIEPTQDLLELANYHVAFTRLGDIHKLQPNMATSTHRNPKEALKMLISGRAQLLLSNPSTIKFWENQGLGSFKPIYTVGDYQIHMCFSHASLGKARADEYASQISDKSAELSTRYK